MDELLSNIRFGLRMIRKSPGFAGVAIATLALGIGANTAMFSFVDGVLLKPLPYPHPEEIIEVWEKPPGYDRNGISTMNFLDWKNQNTVFSAMAAETGGSVTLSGAHEPVQLRGSRVSAPFFSIFGVQPILGRTFAPDEDQPGKDQVVVLSHRIWESRFASDPQIIGRGIVLDNRRCAVIGVLPAGTSFDRGYQDLWMPLAFQAQDMTRDFHWMRAWARLKPGVTLAAARAQMSGIGSRIARAYPKSNKGWNITLDRHQDRLVGDHLRTSLWILLIAVGAVLLIGCVNLANLLLVRASARDREVAIRSAVGASSSQLVRQFLTESLLLAFIGGCAGVAVAMLFMRVLMLWLPPFYLPAEAAVSLDVRALLFTAALTIATGVAFGLAPALQAMRVDPGGALKEAGRSSSTSASGARLRGLLIVSEVALAFVLLSGAGLLIRSFYQLQHVDMGFNATNVVTIHLPMDEKQYTEGTQISEYYRELLDHVQAVPGIRDAAVTSALPMEGWGYGMPFQIDGKPVADIANRPDCFFKMVSPSYFQTLGMHLRKGRALSEKDRQASAPVAVMNETMAAKFFKGEDPVGKRVLVEKIIPAKHALGEDIPWEVVGVVADEKVGDLDDSSPGLYVTEYQSPSVGAGLVIRGNIDSSRLVKSVERAVWEVNRNQALVDAKTMEQVKEESLGGNRLRTFLLMTFAGLALLLAAVGLYGVISYTATQRTHELGLRSALGAPARELVLLVVRRGLALTALGLVIGLGGALALTHLLSSLLFEISPRDPLSLALAALVLSLVAGFASAIPAARATRVDPLVALRYE